MLQSKYTSDALPKTKIQHYRFFLIRHPRFDTDYFSFFFTLSQLRNLRGKTTSIKTKSRFKNQHSSVVANTHFLSFKYKIEIRIKPPKIQEMGI